MLSPLIKTAGTGMFGLSGLYLKLVEIGIALLIVGGGYWWIGNRAVSEYKLELAAEQQVLNDAQQAKYNKLAGELEQLKLKRRENARIITKQVEKIVTRDVYRNDCIDADGLRVLNEAIRGGSVTEPKS